MTPREPILWTGKTDWSIPKNQVVEIKTEPGHGLCFRCEHRAAFLETGIHPRFECGSSMAVHGCYCFMPCKPVAVAPIDGEKRPIFGPWMLAGRIQSYGLVDHERLRLRLVDIDGRAVAAVWTIKPNRKTKKEKA